VSFVKKTHEREEKQYRIRLRRAAHAFLETTCTRSET
jgi:hypothetical protein